MEYESGRCQLCELGLTRVRPSLGELEAHLLAEIKSCPAGGWPDLVDYLHVLFFIRYSRWLDPNEQDDLALLKNLRDRVAKEAAQ